MVVDDDAVRDLAGRVLNGRGYAVLEARDGQQALGMSAHHLGPIHLFVADVLMPGISGRVLAEQLAQTRPDLNLLFMSSYIDETVVHHGVLEAGGVPLQKPFNPFTLARKVRQVLDSQVQ